MSLGGRPFIQRFGPLASFGRSRKSYKLPDSSTESSESCRESSTFRPSKVTEKPYASEVLSAQLSTHPHWTSYFVRYSDIVNDQYGYSHFNWTVNDVNYHILRIGCPPYIKYHCSRREIQNLDLEDRLFRVLKWTNLGIPTVCYGVAAVFLIKFYKDVKLNDGRIVRIFFLNQENTDSIH